jgi:isoleucyl-tRNA synthetase
VADKIATKGSNFWYDANPAEILAGVKLPAGWPAAESLTCGRDTLDVWIDSGSTQAAVLKRGQGGTHWPADLYLEGSDQHRGWFQSSLWCSVIAFGAAPYKAVLTHGFIVDKNRQKISKSSTYQKPQTADAYIAQHGADVIRLWIASQDFRDDIPVDDEILKNVGEAYRLFRNTFRFQLSNLFDFRIAPSTPCRWTRWTRSTAGPCTRRRPHRGMHQGLRRLRVPPRLPALQPVLLRHPVGHLPRHPEGPALHARRRPSRCAARRRPPCTPSSTPWSKSWPPSSPSPPTRPGAMRPPARNTPPSPFHLQDWPVAPAAWRNDALEADFAACSSCAPASPRALNPLRQAGTIGKSLDAILAISGQADDFAVLGRHHGFLPELFIVSQVDLDTKASATLEVAPRHAKEAGHTRCPRCWRWVPKVVHTPHGEVCPRCAEALNS